MTVTYRDKLETDYTTATQSPVVNKPTGVQNGDVMLMWIVTTAPETIAAGPISDWTKLWSADFSTDGTATLWWKIANNESSSWTMTNIFGSTTRCDIVVIAYYGCDQTTPIDTYDGTSTTGTSVSGPSCTPNFDNSMFVQFIGTDPGTGTYAATPDSSPVATERHDAKNSGGSSYEYIAIQEYLQSTAEALALDYTGLTSDSYGHIQIVIMAPRAKSSKSAYVGGISTASSNKSAYAEASSPSYPASSNKAVYLHGIADAVPSNVPAYLQGKLDATPSNKSAFTAGSINVLDNKSAYTQGVSTELSNIPSYIMGSINTLANKSAFILGSTDIISNKPAFINGESSIISNKEAYTVGEGPSLSNKPAYLRGSADFIDNKPAFVAGNYGATANKAAFIQGIASLISNKPSYLSGIVGVSDNKPAYLHGRITITSNKYAYAEGFVGGVLTSKPAFALGYSNPIHPDSDISASGVWWNELNNTNNLYQSIDETYPVDSDYIWNTDPATGYYYECSLSNPPGIPASGEVVVFWRGKDITNLGVLAAKVELRQGSTIISSKVEKLTSTPTTFYLQISQAERDSITDWDDLRVRVLPVYGRLAMKVWVRDLRTKTTCDTFLNYVIGRYTDVAIFAIDDGVNPKEWSGTSTMGTSSTATVDGKTPWAYLYDALHAAGIRVTAWIWITHYSYWGSPSGVDLDIPNNSTYNDGGIYNFHNATARQVIIDEIKDFVDNNNVDGIVFNMEGTTVNITPEDMTNFVIDVRKAIPQVEMAWHVGADDHDDITNKMSPISWLNNNYIDLIYFMAYYGSVTSKLHYLGTNGISAGDRRISAGLGTEANYAQPSDFRQRWLLHKEAGFHNYFHFVWKDNFDDDQGLRDATDAYLDNTLSAVQLPITKVSIIPASGWTITVNGVDETTNYVDVSDHLYSGPLKKHIEAAVGHENPAIIYARQNSTTTEIIIGDYEPDE